MGGPMQWVYMKFQAGGVGEMSAILLTLIISLVIIVERVIRLYFQYDLANTSSFMSHIQKLVMNNSVENAIRSCKKERPKLVPIVLAEGLKRANDTPEEMANAMDYAMLSAIPRVQKWVPFLATTANVATLLGLLGTIHGLMNSFGALSGLSGEEKQAALSAGISQALNATFFGLGTALMCLMAYGILSMKQKAIVDNVNRCSARLTDLLYTRRMRLKGSDSKK